MTFLRKIQPLETTMTRVRTVKKNHRRNVLMHIYVVSFVKKINRVTRKEIGKEGPIQVLNLDSQISIIF